MTGLDLAAAKQWRHPMQFEAEEFWDDLLAFIEERRVIPVVGAELLTLEQNGATVPFYQVVAERLLNKYRPPNGGVDQGALLRPHHELNDAVSALVAAGKRPRDLYRPIHDIVRQLVAETNGMNAALRQLAAIRHFDLFATTTPDGLLARAVDAVRFDGAAGTDQIEYAPSLPTERRRDIPELRTSTYSAVFYMFGKADASPVYAIHDEDDLEFAYTLQYTLQNGVPPARMFAELRSRNLLFIGCNFGEWLGRFFLRLSNEKRLSSDERPKKEFLVDEAIAGDRNLTLFLEQFSRDSRCCPMPAHEFVTELCRRWDSRNPPRNAASDGQVLEVTNPSGAGSVFISYATEDIGAARRLFEDVQQIGGDVAWLDKSVLRPGDDWNQTILRAVQKCDIFVPLISMHTERRTEGYFRLEWSEAADRSRRIQGRKFIFPLVVDAEYGGLDRYALVPPAFRAVQYTHAPAGQLGTDARDELTRQLRILRRGRST
jgi:hypothetical protein